MKFLDILTIATIVSLNIYDRSYAATPTRLVRLSPIQRVAIAVEPESYDARLQRYLDEGNKAFKSGEYYQAIRHYTYAIDSLKSTKTGSNVYYGSGTYQNISDNLITVYKNRALTYLKLHSKEKDGSSDYKDKALKDLGEVADIYSNIGDRVRAFETVQSIRGLGGNKEFRY
jgi:tetratricopeptide (TPR) repeat protein